MIAIDLSPLVLDPFRGVARALRHLLQGLENVRRGALRIEGVLPIPPADGSDLRRSVRGLDALHEIAGPPPSGPVWRVALRHELDRLEARVLLAPWAAFPRTDVPVVTWIHEVPFARHGALEGAVRTLRHRRALTRAVERARSLVVPSESARADLLALHPEADARTHVVPHGFDPRPWEVDARAPQGLRPGEFALLIGTGGGAGGPRKKGVDVLVRAFAGPRPAALELVVVGASPGLPARTRVVPEIDDVSLAHLVAAARVLVVPSRSEGFGYPMLEAFAAGVPVVASAAGALPEVSGGAARLVPPGDADALVEAITRVATDEALRARMIRDGKKRAGEFPVEAMARGWLRVLCAAGGLPCPV